MFIENQSSGEDGNGTEWYQVQLVDMDTLEGQFFEMEMDGDKITYQEWREMTREEVAATIRAEMRHQAITSARRISRLEKLLSDEEAAALTLAQLVAEQNPLPVAIGQHKMLHAQAIRLAHEIVQDAEDTATLNQSLLKGLFVAS